MDAEWSQEQLSLLEEEFVRNPFVERDTINRFAEMFEVEFDAVQQWFLTRQEEMRQEEMRQFEKRRRFFAQYGKALIRDERGERQEFMIPEGFISTVQLPNEQIKTACESQFRQNCLNGIDAFVAQMEREYGVNGFTIRSWFLQMSMAWQSLYTRHIPDVQPIVTFPASPTHEPETSEHGDDQGTSLNIREVVEDEFQVVDESQEVGTVEYPQSSHNDVDVIYLSSDDDTKQGNESDTEKLSGEGSLGVRTPSENAKVSTKESRRRKRERRIRNDKSAKKSRVAASRADEDGRASNVSDTDIIVLSSDDDSAQEQSPKRPTHSQERDIEYVYVSSDEDDSNGEVNDNEPQDTEK